MMTLLKEMPELRTEIRLLTEEEIIELMAFVKSVVGEVTPLVHEFPSLQEIPEVDDIEPTSFMVRHEHVRILRELAAYCCKRLPPSHQSFILTELKRYAKAVEPYCECPEKVFLANEKAFACLDCGKREKTLKVVK